MLIMSSNEGVTIKKVVICKETLSSVKNDLVCTQSGCNKVFKSSSNLDLHLWKSHKIQEKMPSTENSAAVIQYHCPEAGCKYNLEQGRSFSKVKLLKQHYLQMHATRNFKCEVCSVFFPTLAAKNYHAKTCGCQFVCSCGKVYTNDQAIKVHAYRHKHKLPANYIVKVSVANQEQQTIEALPAIQLMAAVALSELCRPIQKDAEVQTEVEEKQKKKQTTPTKITGPKRRKSTTSQETQTQSTSSTILKRAMIDAKIPVRAAKRKRNTETQTIRKTPKKAKNTETQTAQSVEAPPVMPELKSDSPLLEEMSKEQPEVINDVGLPEGWINQKSTQTMPFDYPSLDTLLNDFKVQQSCETQTDLFDESFLNDCEASFSINTETQTCDELNETLESMLYSNMCTQTCDELLSSLDFVDIETQTLQLD